MVEMHVKTMDHLRGNDYVKGRLSRTLGRFRIPGKGILAMDEDPDVLSSRLETVTHQNIENQWTSFLKILCKAPYIENYISGVLFCPKTAFALSNMGASFKDVILNREILTGIHFDTNKSILGGSCGEYVVEGLDDMPNRFAKLRQQGFKFAQWKCVLKIGSGAPFAHAIKVNTDCLALFACESQNEGILPILHTEVSSEGDHDLEQCQKATETFLSFLVKSLIDSHVYLEGILLKPSFVVPGIKCNKKYELEDIIEATIITIKRTIPVAVPGIILSGNYTESEAANYLNAFYLYEDFKPWKFFFCLDQALQERAAQAWLGAEENTKAAQEAFYQSLVVMSHSSLGTHGSPEEAEDLKDGGKKKQQH